LPFSISFIANIARKRPELNRDKTKLHEVAQAGSALIAEAGLKQIAALYQIEKTIRGLIAEERLGTRQDRSAPLFVAFEAWFTTNRARLSAKAPLGEALKYIAKYWDGLCLFLTDGRIEMDNNTPSHRYFVSIARQWSNAQSGLSL
jgi:hypothetical protein